MRVTNRSNRSSSAVLIYVIILVSFQVFLMTIAVEAFMDDDEALAWSTAGVSVVMAAAAFAFIRYLRP
ncbi:DUF6755 family protein [Ilumatobacter sp.]|uniref:DUF6755 family protein n=1 Tax=Ilumatobacter sp. TaxID=1967498 RepID=UPI003C3C79FA